ncbi:NAC domain containing protein 74 [Perilla frutescens var. hirtella]|uniref:NAC domain containing protein 74 n=1 Tax=Perilla frutescens var. hirtella TaxID=608512 RepID=A0AAD4JIN5_PERFH|nr:NAC domain containing protein 74 [Perilla frutescens var. hirtella]
MGLRDIGCTLPPGFRFYPSDEELVFHYLQKKVANEEVLRGTLIEIDLHTCEPWQLPDVAKLNSNEWYFFSFRDRKYTTGYRTNRATTSGYWKATGKDRAVLDPISRTVVGMRKTLVFYKNRAPNGIKSGWIMHEFRLENPHMPPKEDWVLCRVFYKSRGENGSNFSPQICCDHSTAGDTSPNLATSPTNEHALPNTHQNMITSFYQGQNPSTSVGLSPLHSGYFHMYREERDENVVPRPSTSNHNQRLVETKCEDDYGFLFDMSIDYSNGVASFLEDARFDNDSSSVFI